MKALVDIFTAAFDSIKAIVDAIVGAFSFLVSFIGDLIYVVGLTADALVSLPELLRWLPAAVSTVIVLILTIAVIYKVMGREG